MENQLKKKINSTTQSITFSFTTVFTRTIGLLLKLLEIVLIIRKGKLRCNRKTWIIDMQRSKCFKHFWNSINKKNLNIGEVKCSKNNARPLLLHHLRKAIYLKREFILRIFLWFFFLCISVTNVHYKQS